MTRCAVPFYAEIRGYWVEVSEGDTEGDNGTSEGVLADGTEGG